MPEQGLDWVPRKDLLSFEEIMRLLNIYRNLGITKLRFTGGEPFLRKDFMALLESVFDKNWFEQISITTNGTLCKPYLPKLKALGVDSINLSLDTIDEARFNTMTRRNDFQEVMASFQLMLDNHIVTKINAVVIDGKNEEDIVPLALLTRDKKVDVRFIEEMPFNGVGQRHAIKWNHVAILNELKLAFPTIQKIADPENSTSLNFHIPGHEGNIGIIPSWTRSFCGTCNRIRLTPKGVMKTCLYDNGKIDLQMMIRNGLSDEEIKTQILKAIGSRAKDGIEAEQNRFDSPISESMATIGG